MSKILNHQTNNTIYDRKHRYMFILRDLTALKNQISYEVLNDGLSKARAIEIQDIYTRIIVSLIEEGVTYEYIDNATNPKDDVIRLHIDGSIYECRNIDIREVLEDRYEEVMSERYKGPSFSKIQKDKRKNAAADDSLNSMQNNSKINKNNDKSANVNANDVTNLLLGIKDAINESSKQAIENIKTANTENPGTNNNASDSYIKKQDIDSMMNELKNTIKETSAEKAENKNAQPTIIIDTSDDTSYQKKKKNKAITKLINYVITIIVIIIIAAIINFTPGLKTTLMEKTNAIIHELKMENEKENTEEMPIENYEENSANAD